MISRKARSYLRRGAEKAGVTTISTRNIPFGFDWLLDVRRLNELWKLPTDVFFDVGANDGTISSRIRDYFVAAEIHAFEPHPTAFARLQAVAAEKHFRCYNQALSDSNGTAKLYAAGHDKLSSLLPQPPALPFGDPRGATIDVATVTMDHFCDHHRIGRPDVLKIDVEGHELAVLTGARRVLAEGRVSFVYVEFTNLVRLDEEQSASLLTIAKLLLPHGLQFIASYTEQVSYRDQPGGADRYALVCNGLFARTPRAQHQPPVLAR